MLFIYIASYKCKNIPPISSNLNRSGPEPSACCANCPVILPAVVLFLLLLYNVAPNVVVSAYEHKRTRSFLGHRVSVGWARFVGSKVPWVRLRLA
jgi:hypothetical protein